MQYLDNSINDFNVMHQYLAQIAAEVRRSAAAHPERVDQKDFLLKFIKEPQEEEETEVEEGEVLAEQRERESMRMWLQCVGVDVAEAAED